MKRTLRSWVVSHVGLAAMFLASGADSRAEGPVKLPTLNESGRPTRVVEAEGFRVELDLSGQVIDASAEEEGFSRYGNEPFREDDTVEIVSETSLTEGDAEVTRLKSGRRFVVAEVGPQSLTIRVLVDGKLRTGRVSTAHVKRVDAPRDRMHAAPTGLPGNAFVSTGVLLAKAKQFDDGLYAAVELAAQKGAGDFAGKKRMLDKLLERLEQTPATEASGIVATAAFLGLIRQTRVPELNASVNAAAAAFLDDEMRSKPLGFYTWSDELTQIFQQDRILQSPLTRADGADAVVAALRADEESNRIYTRYLGLVSRLTNPWDYADFRGAAAGKEELQTRTEYFVFPPSRSHEGELIKKLFGNRLIPEGFDLMNELIARVRNGTIDLKPTKDSGWYDYQTYALETLAVPQKAAEAAKIRYDAEYQKLLTDYFKGALALARETHVKQLESPSAGAAFLPEVRKKIHIGTEISVEPTATHYRRRAEAYRFVHAVLRDTFGEAGLNQMHRLTADGPVTADLNDELTRMTALFDGAALVAARQLGLKDAGAPPGSKSTTTAVSADAASEATAQAYLAWAADADRDPDLKRDARMMVPVFYDVNRKKMKVWVFLGWKLREVSYRFGSKPEARVFDAAGKQVDLNDPKSPELVWHGSWTQIRVPVVEEAYVTRLLDRDEFRRHCDAYQSRTAILTNLE